MKKIGLFYAAKAEKTSWVAERIQKEFGESHIKVVPIETRLGRTILLLMIVLLSEPPLGLTESCLLIGTSCCRSLERWI